MAAILIAAFCGEGWIPEAAAKSLCSTSEGLLGTLLEMSGKAKTTACSATCEVSLTDERTIPAMTRRYAPQTLMAGKNTVVSTHSRCRANAETPTHGSGMRQALAH